MADRKKKKPMIEEMDLSNEEKQLIKHKRRFEGDEEFSEEDLSNRRSKRSKPENLWEDSLFGDSHSGEEWEEEC